MIAVTSDAHLTRTIDAPLDRVWSALTEPAELVSWFWPPAFGTQVELDARPGGTVRIIAPGRLAVRGRCLVADPPHRFAFTWQWDGEELATTVRLDLSSVDDGGTRLTVQHQGFPDDATRDDHVTGWSDCLARLAVALARPEEPGPPSKPGLSPDVRAAPPRIA